MREVMTKIYKSFKEHIALVLIIVFALVIFTLFSAATYSQYEIQDWKCVFFGEFGDTFGMLNTLFSAFAMAFAGYAIYYQGKELKAQKKELHLTRVEFETTRATNMLHKQIELFNASMGKAGFKSLDLEHLSNYMNKISIAVEENKSINVEPSFNTSLLQAYCLKLFYTIYLFNILIWPKPL